VDKFSYRELRDKVDICRGGRVVTTLRARAAVRFLERVAHRSDEEQQRLMAAATGQYKFGNERAGKSR
jgi:hypothetical protein